jgi:hypothetical protein
MGLKSVINARPLSLVGSTPVAAIVIEASR